MRLRSLYCFFQNVKMQQYRFSVIMNELQATENASYTATVLSVINALIFGTDDLRQRDKLRKEFIGRFRILPWVRCRNASQAREFPSLSSYTPTECMRTRQLSLWVYLRIGPPASFSVEKKNTRQHIKSLSVSNVVCFFIVRFFFSLL